MRTWEKSGCDGTLSISSRTKPGEFWDTGVETEGSGLRPTDSSPSPSTTCSSGDSDVSIGSPGPVNADGGELRPLDAGHLLTVGNSLTLLTLGCSRGAGHNQRGVGDVLLGGCHIVQGAPAKQCRWSVCDWRSQIMNNININLWQFNKKSS